MIRISLAIYNDDIKNRIIKQYQDNQEIKIEEYNDVKNADIYFIEVKSEDDIHQYADIKNKNHFSFIVLIGQDNSYLMKKGYSLEPVDYIRIEYLAEDFKELFVKLDNLMKKRFKTYLFETKNSKANIRLNAIYYVESFKHYIHIHTKTGEYIERKNISQFIEEMDEYGFIQIHKSYAINLDNIKMISTNEVEMINGEKLLIGRKFKDILIQKYENRKIY